ncbi:hypothetical protein ACU61A_41890 [Pseudonocardia sichuanensis]|uniref:Uncharacterized protein n=1 Tax=Pseudonocardia kunmingensis TaxID=630975 RepID=A0A543DW08_9PSEU|nr:hypothetical protein [Pseudonocardia kunmingensis]TQM13516.1 hypothetical protein FB558_0265 [Pseudonocardia kunmingensis]
MRIQHDATLTMNLQVELALPREGREGGETLVVVLPTGGDGDPTSMADRWSFTVDEAEQLGAVLLDAAQKARDMA